MNPVTYSSLKRKSVKYMLISSTTVVHKQHTSHTAELFDTHIEILFSKISIQRQKIIEGLPRLCRQSIGRCRDGRAILVDNFLYNKNKKVSQVY